MNALTHFPASAVCVCACVGAHAGVFMCEHDAGGGMKRGASSLVRQMCPKRVHIYGNGSDRR